MLCGHMYFAPPMSWWPSDDHREYDQRHTILVRRYKDGGRVDVTRTVGGQRQIVAKRKREKERKEEHNDTKTNNIIIVEQHRTS